jgi:hypothetical protein
MTPPHRLRPAACRRSRAPGRGSRHLLSDLLARFHVPSGPHGHSANLRLSQTDPETLRVITPGRSPGQRPRDGEYVFLRMPLHDLQTGGNRTWVLRGISGRFEVAVSPGGGRGKAITSIPQPSGHRRRRGQLRIGHLAREGLPPQRSRGTTTGGFRVQLNALHEGQPPEDDGPVSRGRPARRARGLGG